MPANSSYYWLISVPYEEPNGKTKTVKYLKQKLDTDSHMCEAHEFRIPKLKTGTLDELLALSDELQKYDSTLEQVSAKMARLLGDLLEQERKDQEKKAAALAAAQASSGASGSKKAGYSANVAAAENVSSLGVDISNYQPEIILQDDKALPVQLYLNYFQWDENQFLVTKPLKDISESINKKAIKYDEELKMKSNEYNQVKTAISALERRQTGLLSTRPLDGLVTKDMIIDSEYLHTLFIAVPKNLEKNFFAEYEDLIHMHEMETLQEERDNLKEELAEKKSEPKQSNVDAEKKRLEALKDLESKIAHMDSEVKKMASGNDGHMPLVVPDSVELISQDAEFVLFSIVLFRKAIDDFKHACASRKYIVREFQYDEQRYQLAQLELEDMEEKRNNLRRELFQWCQVGFSETFSSWMHIKAIRVYVESILRYGLPANNVYMLLKVPPKSDRRVHKFLQEEYKYLAQSQEFEGSAKISEEELMSAGGAMVMGMGIDLSHPYVHLTINLNNLPLLQL